MTCDMGEKSKKLEKDTAEGDEEVIQVNGLEGSFSAYGCVLFCIMLRPEGKKLRY